MAFRLGPSLVVAALTVLPVGQAWANLPLQPAPTTIDFETFTGDGFAPMPAAGQLDSDFWVVRGVSDGDSTFGGTFTMGDYAEGLATGAVSEGGVFAFDVGDSITLGASLTVDDFTPGSFVLRLRNDTGQSITSLRVAYMAWVLNSGNTSSSFAFSWSLDDASYTNVPGLGFTTAGNAPPSPEWVGDSYNTTIVGINVAEGDNIYLRWSFDSAAGGGQFDEIGIGDIVLTVLNVCGNGIMEAGEACDDGNASNTDACVQGCVMASCGDGFVRAGIETCDDGNASNDDACPSGVGGTCQDAFCGDGFTQAGVEDCDDANDDDTDACVAACTAARCGDGFLQAGVEDCDDGNMDNGDACPDGDGGTCADAVCGDGFVQDGVEECDDGNRVDDDACANDCTSTGVTTDDTTATTDEPTTGEPMTSDTMDESDSATTDAQTSTDTTDGSATNPTTGQPTSSSTDPTMPGTSGDTDTGMAAGEEPPGCTCRSGSGGGWLLPLLFWIGAVRRRKRAVGRRLG